MYILAQSGYYVRVTFVQHYTEYHNLYLVQTSVSHASNYWKTFFKLLYFINDQTFDENEAVVEWTHARTSYEEIAETLQVPLGTVKAQLHRSREQLFKIMSGARSTF